MILGLLLFLAGCVRQPDGVQPVGNFDLDSYLGKWYEVARLDHSFERGMEQVTADYSLRDDGGVRVLNRGYSVTNKEWNKADSYYETAIGLTTRPAGVMNNWGYSKLTRGDYAAAERLFTDAVRQDDSLFTAKNNLVMARGAQKKYSLPVLSMSQSERAQLLYTLGLSAIKQGDTSIGKGLLRDAIETHPQHFEAAVRSLRALEDNVSN